MLSGRAAALLAALVVAALTGCVQQPTLRLATAGSERPRPLWELHFEGNTRFSDATLRSKLASEVSDYRTIRYFDPDTLADDQRRIVALYRAHGYYGARVTDVRYFEWQGGQLVVVLQIDEGPVTRVRSVEVTGMPPGLTARLPLGKGDAMEHQRYLDGKDRLGRRLRLSGYAHAEVSGEVLVDPGTLSADIKVTVKPGALSEFGPIAVGAPKDEKPLAGDDAAVVRNLLTFKKGRRYSEDELEETKNRLYETGAFEQVEVDPDLSGGGRVVPVDVKVTLGRPRQLRFGVGVGSDRNQQETRGSVSWLNRNFHGGLRSLELTGRLAYAWLPTVVAPDVHGVVASAGARAIEPARTRALLDFSQGLSADTQLVDEYRSFGAKPDLGVARRWVRFRRKVTVGLSYSAEVRGFDFFKAVPAQLALEVGVEDRFLLSYFEPSLVLDTRNDPLDPTRGVYLALTTDHSVSGSYRFDRFVPELRTYLPVLGAGGRWLTVAGRARVGLIRPRYTGETVHVSQRFFAGGASSHRGFGFRHMSPRCYIPDNDSSQCTDTPIGPSETFLIGGQTLLESSFELRTTPWRFLLGGTPAGFGGVVFLDAGRVGAPDDTASDFTLQKLELALGWGLRFDTIAGPLRLDVGYRVGDKNKNGLGTEPPVAVHLSFGQAF